jgi:hypothetical protein
MTCNGSNRCEMVVSMPDVPLPPMDATVPDVVTGDTGGRTDSGGGTGTDADRTDGGPGADGGSTASCAGITCSGHGTCFAAGRQAVCACNAGYVPDSTGLQCVACVTTSSPPPRLVAPSSGAIVSSHRPTVRWINAAGATGAVVQFCRDRACTIPVGLASATGTSVRNATPLPAGPVFVRAYSTSAAPTPGCFPPAPATSPAWVLRLGPVNKPIDSWIPGPHDGNGDGWSDQLVTSDPATNRNEPLLELQGGRRALATMTVNTVTAPGTLCQGAFGRAALRAGDINGDGFGDAVVTCIRPGAGFRSMVLPGSPTGLQSTPLGPTVDGVQPLAAADFDSDGYGDVVFREVTAVRNALLVHRGGPTGLATTSSAVMNALNHGNVFGEVAVVLDFNGDGRMDLVAGSLEGPRYFLATASGLPNLATGLIPALYFGVDALLSPTQYRL